MTAQQHYADYIEHLRDVLKLGVLQNMPICKKSDLVVSGSYCKLHEDDKPYGDYGAIIRSPATQIGTKNIIKTQTRKGSLNVHQGECIFTHRGFAIFKIWGGF